MSATVAPVAPVAPVATIEQVEALALLEESTQWTTKAGRTITRHSPIGAISAPKAVQVHAATAATATQWANGQFRPFLKDVRSCLTDKQALAVANVAMLSPTNKHESEGFLTAVLHELTHKAVGNIITEITPKGEKARIVATIRTILV